MSRDEIQALWTRWVGGEELLLDEQKALVAALEADPALRAELLEDVQLDGSLRALGDARRGGEAFTAQVAGCLEPERDATRFIRKVESRLAEPPPEPAGNRGGRGGALRVSRRFLHRPEENAAGWKAALVAAGALFAILLFSTAFSKRPSPPVAKSSAEAKAPPPPAPVRVPDPAPKLPPLPRPVEKEPVKRVPPLPEGPEYREPGKFEVPPPRPLETPAPKPAEDTSEPPAPPPPPAPTRAVAVVGPAFKSVSGKVYLARKLTRPQAGDALEYGQDVYTRGSGRAVLQYPDGTLVDLGADTMVRDLSTDAGQRLSVSIGEIDADIRKQPDGKPMIFATPHAEATVLGTRITLRTADDKNRTIGATLLVHEGKVAFKRLRDDATTLVAAGENATSSASVRDLKARSSFPEEFTVRFAPPDAPKAPKVYLDSGEPFSAAKSYGWDGTRDGQVVPNEKQPDGKTDVLAGRGAVWKYDPADPKVRREDLKAAAVAAGWGAHAETWKIELPNGRYVVGVCVGDYTYEQGPHHVSVDGFQLIDRVKTRQGKFIEKDVLVDVTRGEIILKVGGYTTPQKSVDTSKDTLINYVTIRRVPAKQ